MGREALRTRHTHGMEVRKKRPRGLKKGAQGVQVSPLNPLRMYLFLPVANMSVPVCPSVHIVALAFFSCSASPSRHPMKCCTFICLG